MDSNVSNDIDIVKIYSNDDEKMQKLGHILGTPKSRKIYGILIDKELNAKEIGKLIDNEDNPRLPNLIYHLDKMVDIGLLTVEQRIQRKNGPVLKYYKAVPFVLIVPKDHVEKAQKSKTLRNTFKRVFKFVVIPTATLVSTLSHSAYVGFFTTQAAGEEPFPFVFNETTFLIGSLALVTLLFIHKLIFSRKRHSIIIE